MRVNAFGQTAFLVGSALVGLGAAQVALVQIGHGADNQLRRAVGRAQGEHLLFGRLFCCADNMHIQRRQHMLRRVQKRGRIVVASGNHHVATAPLRRQTGKKAVIQRLHARRGRLRVKHIARHQQHIDFLRRQCVQQPVQKGGKHRLWTAAMKGAPQMPVGRVQQGEGSRRHIVKVRKRQNASARIICHRMLHCNLRRGRGMRPKHSYPGRQ